MGTEVEIPGIPSVPEKKPGPAPGTPGGPWKKGQSGNPAGRPKGSRNKLGTAFLDALHNDFLEYGESVIERVRRTDPTNYLKVIASVVPKDLNINVNPLEQMTDDELLAELDAIAAVQKLLPAPTPGGGIAPGAGITVEGTVNPTGPGVVQESS
mgnify:CR=1 FL=1